MLCCIVCCFLLCGVVWRCVVWREDGHALLDCTSEKLGDFGFGKAGQNKAGQVGFQMSRPTIGEETVLAS